MPVISEAELIEAEHCFGTGSVFIEGFNGKKIEVRYLYLHTRETRLVELFRQLIALARAGQLCAECGAVIVPGTEPHGTKAV